MLISQRLEKLATHRTDAAGAVARFLLEDATHAETLSMRQIAEATVTSKPTLVRVAQQLGYSGWRDFFDAWRLELAMQRERMGTVNHSLPFAAGATTREIADTVARVASESSWQTSQMQDARQIERAAELLAAAPVIALFGISVNELCLRLFQRKMMQLGVRTHLSPQAEMGLFCQTLGAGDCAVVVSYTGETADRTPMRHVETMRERGVRIISISGEGPNYLREHADAALTIFSQESLYAKIGTFSTETSINTVLDILYACYFARDYERNLARKMEISAAVEHNRQPRPDEATAR